MGMWNIHQSAQILLLVIQVVLIALPLMKRDKKKESG
jgi:hypothetical protein